jgi:hypothetical protein
MNDLLQSSFGRGLVNAIQTILVNLAINELDVSVKKRTSAVLAVTDLPSPKP